MLSEYDFMMIINGRNLHSSAVLVNCLVNTCKIAALQHSDMWFWQMPAPKSTFPDKKVSGRHLWGRAVGREVSEPLLCLSVVPSHTLGIPQLDFWFPPGQQKNNLKCFGVLWCPSRYPILASGPRGAIVEIHEAHKPVWCYITIFTLNVHHI